MNLTIPFKNPNRLSAHNLGASYESCFIINSNQVMNSTSSPFIIYDYLSMLTRHLRHTYESSSSLISDQILSSIPHHSSSSIVVWIPSVDAHLGQIYESHPSSIIISDQFMNPTRLWLSSRTNYESQLSSFIISNQSMNPTRLQLSFRTNLWIRFVFDYLFGPIYESNPFSIIISDQFMNPTRLRLSSRTKLSIRPFYHHLGPIYESDPSPIIISDQLKNPTPPPPPLPFPIPQYSAPNYKIRRLFSDYVDPIKNPTPLQSLSRTKLWFLPLIDYLLGPN